MSRAEHIRNSGTKILNASNRHESTSGSKVSHVAGRRSACGQTTSASAPVGARTCTIGIAGNSVSPSGSMWVGAGGSSRSAARGDRDETDVRAVRRTGTERLEVGSSCSLYVRTNTRPDSHAMHRPKAACKQKWNT